MAIRLYRAVVEIDACFLADDSMDTNAMRRLAEDALNAEVRWNPISPPFAPQPVAIARVTKADRNAPWFHEWSDGIAFGENPRELTVRQIVEGEEEP